MPVSGHWHMRHRAEEYLERRSHEIDADRAGRARARPPSAPWREWKRLEPPAIGHERPLLHEFFGRTRTCLATMDGEGGERDRALLGRAPTATSARRWARRPEDLVPVVLAALDRVAKTQEPESLGVFCTTDSWWLLRPAAPARLQRALAELGDVLGAAARGSTATCRPARARLL